jgi:hypothetical protein
MKNKIIKLINLIIIVILQLSIIFKIIMAEFEIDRIAIIYCPIIIGVLIILFIPIKYRIIRDIGRSLLFGSLISILMFFILIFIIEIYIGKFGLGPH